MQSSYRVQTQPRVFGTFFYSLSFDDYGNRGANYSEDITPLEVLLDMIEFEMDMEDAALSGQEGEE